ncbi:MAG TPA: hypothetical protein VGO43_00385 [Pyrinomonadaceae bacterium]|nr:hypothetical protein [Pyrinomonadaceae bacterium]
MIPIGLCFAILPVVELVKQTTYGGYVFGTHPLASGSAVFWALVVFHVLIAVIPIMGGVLLLVFPPRHVDAIPEAATVEAAAGTRPGMRTGTKVIIGMVAGMVLLVSLVVAAVVGGSYYLFRRMDDPVLVKKRETARTDGTQFGKTTDQNGCMDKAYTLAAPTDSFDMSSHYFTKSCLKASRPSPNFCDGVPFVLDRDWFGNQCNAVGHDTNACLEAYTAKRDFCRLDAD